MKQKHIAKMTFPVDWGGEQQEEIKTLRGSLMTMTGLEKSL